MNSAKTTSVINKDKAYRWGDAPFATEMYKLFLILYNGDNFKLQYLSENNLDNLYKYSNSKTINTNILNEIRDRVFKHKNSNSIIVNEIKGIYEFLSGCKDYIKATVNIYKNG